MRTERDKEDGGENGHKENNQEEITLKERGPGICPALFSDF